MRLRHVRPLGGLASFKGFAMIYPTITYCPPDVTITLPRFYVIAYLADTNGNPARSTDSASFIKTELFDDRDNAFAEYDQVCESEPIFISLHTADGESLV